jgi:hypothetical protein
LVGFRCLASIWLLLVVVVARQTKALAEELVGTVQVFLASLLVAVLLPKHHCPWSLALTRLRLVLAVPVLQIQMVQTVKILFFLWLSATVAVVAQQKVRMVPTVVLVVVEVIVRPAVVELLARVSMEVQVQARAGGLAFLVVVVLVKLAQMTTCLLPVVMVATVLLRRLLVLLLRGPVVAEEERGQMLLALGVPVAAETVLITVKPRPRKMVK